MYIVYIEDGSLFYHVFFQEIRLGLQIQYPSSRRLHRLTQYIQRSDGTGGLCEQIQRIFVTQRGGGIYTDVVGFGELFSGNLRGT